jgi:hypothetical protein
MKLRRPARYLGFAALAASAGLCASVAICRDDWWPVRESGIHELAALTGRRAELRSRETQVHSSEPWTPARLQLFKEQLKPHWVVTSKSEIVKGRFPRFVISATNPAAPEWSECLRLLDMLECEPAIRLSELKFGARGSAAARRLDEVRIAVAIYWDGAAGRAELQPHIGNSHSAR